MNLIDQYVYAVVKRLPEKARADVEKELRANIEDMLPDDYTDADVQHALLTLGNPAVLANRYRDNPRYLIGPELYGNYLYVMKVVMLVALFSIPVAAFTSVVTDARYMGVYEIAMQIVVQFALMAVQAFYIIFACVTILFAILDRVDRKYVQWPFTGKPWTIQDLDEVPPPSSAIGKSGPIFLIVFSVLAGGALSLFPHLIGWSRKDDGWSITLLFNLDVLRAYVPALVALTAFSVILASLQLIGRRWTMRLALINAALQASSIVFVCLFLLDPHLFAESFIAIAAEGVNVDIEEFNRYWLFGKIGLTFIIVLTSTWDAISALLKARKA
ncbi:hypothetical protein ACF3MZ_26260 [Paenibacillaceae bacterium WGS1546]|uniref:hypothetical protein n=1 Tax=Cohnella sp. WGS1546 TaxID=3366810 RepID=UPI00372D66FE